MSQWMTTVIAATIVLGLVGISLAATGRPFVGISMAVFSVATAHLNWVHRHD